MLSSPDLQELCQFNCSRNIHPKSNSIHDRLIDLASDLETAMGNDLFEWLCSVSDNQYKGSVRPLRLDTIASTISAMKQVSLSAGCLTASNTLNFTSSSCTLNFSSPL